MTHCHVGEFERWRLAVQRAILTLSDVNAIAINTIVARLAAVALVWLSSGAVKLSSCCLHRAALGSSRQEVTLYHVGIKTVNHLNFGDVKEARYQFAFIFLHPC